MKSLAYTIGAIEKASISLKEANLRSESLRLEIASMRRKKKAGMKISDHDFHDKKREKSIWNMLRKDRQRAWDAIQMEFREEAGWYGIVFRIDGEYIVAPQVEDDL